MPIKPGFVRIDLVRSCDGEYCLVVNGFRVAGCKPALTEKNVEHTWYARIDDVRQALGDSRCAELERELEELAAVNELHVKDRNEALARPMSPEAIRRGKEAIRRLRARQAEADEQWMDACADAHGSGQECERDRVKRELEAWIAETEATGMLDFAALRKVTDWTVAPTTEVKDECPGHSIPGVDGP